MSRPDLQGLRILYIEDEHDVREELSAFLRPRVSELITAENGKDGLVAAEQHAPDLILTDIQMPVMDGLSFTRELRKRGSTIPVIITTAFNEDDRLREAAELGVSAYITKPIRLKKLVETIAQYACATI